MDRFGWIGNLWLGGMLIAPSVLKMTGETPEVRSDKRKPTAERGDREEKK